MIENSDAVFVRRPFSFRPPSAYIATGQFFHSNCAPIVWSPWGSQSVPPCGLSFSTTASATGSISIDLKFSKPISSTRLQLAFERKEGEGRGEGERVKSSWCCRHRCGRGGGRGGSRGGGGSETGLRKGCYCRQKGYLTHAAAAEKGRWSFSLSSAPSIFLLLLSTIPQEARKRAGEGAGAGGRTAKEKRSSFIFTIFLRSPGCTRTLGPSD